MRNLFVFFIILFKLYCSENSTVDFNNISGNIIKSEISVGGYKISFDNKFILFSDEKGFELRRTSDNSIVFKEKGDFTQSVTYLVGNYIVNYYYMSDNLNLTIWEITSQKKIFSKIVSSYSISKDGKKFIFKLDNTEKIVVYNLEQGKTMYTIDEVGSISCLNDDFFISLNKGTMKVREIKTGKYISSLKPEDIIGDVTAKKYYISSSYEAGFLSIWNLKTGKKLLNFLDISTHEEQMVVSISQDEKYLLTNLCKENEKSSPNSLKIYEIATGKLLKILEFQEEQMITHVNISNNNKYFIVENISWMHNRSEKKLYVYEIETGKLMYSFPGELLSLSSSGNYIISKQNDSLEIREINGGKNVYTSHMKENYDLKMISNDELVVMTDLASNKFVIRKFNKQLKSIKIELKDIRIIEIISLILIVILMIGIIIVLIKFFLKFVDVKRLKAKIKKYIIILIPILGLSLLLNWKFKSIDYSNVRVISGIAYNLNENKALNGTVILKDNDGKILLQKTYKNGKLSGRYIENDEYGNTKIKAKYKNGKLNGDYIEYTKDTRIEAEYKDGNLDGIRTTYSSNGSLLEKKLYENGKMNGERLYQSLTDDYRFIWVKEQYKDGILDGDYIEYDNDEKVESKGQYNNGKKQGKWVNYNLKGQISKRKIYKNDILIKEEQLAYYENGNIRNIWQIKNGKKNGEARVFYENGNIKIIGKYKDGVQEGKTIWYYENGNVYGKGKLKNGKKEGEFISYNEDGSFQEKIQYENDEIKVKF